MKTSTPRAIARSLLLLTATAAIAVAGTRTRTARAEARTDALPAAPGGMLAVDSLPSPAGPGSAEPFLTSGPDGRIYLSWLQAVDSAHALRFSAFDGSAWSAPRTIVQRRDFFVNWADFPSLHVMPGGRMAAHWLQRNGGGTFAYGVRIAQSMDNGGTWSAPVTPHRDSSETEHGFVALWHEGASLGAVWLDGRGYSKAGHHPANEMSLRTTTLSANGTRRAEVQLDDRTCDCCQNAVAVTSAGPIIAYRNRSAEEIRDIYVTRRVGGTWKPGVAAHADNWKIAACPVNGPSLDARGQRVALSWFTAANDSARVNVAFSTDAGATFGAPVRIDGGSPTGRVDVKLMPNGAALVTWVERMGGEVAAVRARRVSSAGVAGVPVTIASSSAARASGFPKAIVTGRDVMFAWTVPGKPSTVRVARAPLSEFK